MQNLKKNFSNLVNLSIITINKNNSSGLQRTIESVISQTSSDYEFIIIDGASDDKSVDVITQYSAALAYWISEPDCGVYSAMNKGIRVARGEYCLFLNSGDYLADEETLTSFFDLNADEDIIYGNLSLNGNIYKYPEELSLYNLRWGVLPHQASFIRRELFNQYGFYSEKYKIASDWEFWMKAIIIHNCSYKHIDLLVTVQEPLGLSAKLDYEEGKEILLSLFPERIISDYDRFQELDFYSSIDLFKFLEQNRGLFKFLCFVKKLSTLKKGIKGNLNKNRSPF